MTDESSSFAEFAVEWIAAFNAHDVSRIMSHYHDDVELVSPLYLTWTGGISDRVRGSAALEAYFRAALERHPDLHFQLLEIGLGARGPCIRYRTSLDGRVAMEAIELDEDGRAMRVMCHYVAA